MYWIGLTGGIGAGKSTVARLLARFYDPDQGRVRLDGVDLRDLALVDLRAAVAVGTQRPVLFSAPLRDNLLAGRSDAPWEDVLAACEAAGVDAFLDQLPDGYDTLIGEHGFSLSGGQRQRIAIARAVIADPRVLILDDATSSVDPTKEHEIRAALGEVMRHARPAHAAADDHDAGAGGERGGSRRRGVGHGGHRRSSARTAPRMFPWSRRM